MTSQDCSCDSNLEEATFSGSIIAEEEEDSKFSESSVKPGNELLYKVDDAPPWHLCIVLGFQHYLTMVGSALPYPILLGPMLCIGEGNPAVCNMISTTFFVSGLITLLQTTFGSRLPIVQGTCVAIFVSTSSILSTSFGPCDVQLQANMTSTEQEEYWQVRMREIQGALIIASLFQVFVGWTGIIGLVQAWLTPLVVAPTIALVGLSLFDVAANLASQHWGIAALTILLITLFAQYFSNIAIPVLTYNPSTRGVTITKAYIFKLFPVLLAMLVSWGTCALLTSIGFLPEGNKARTDLNPELLDNSPWFRIPYPGQWGVPTVSTAGVLGMMAGVIASIIESVGDYNACAKIAGVPPPPVHAINRGISIEGFGSVLAGLWGSGNGTTSFSQNIGTIGITKVGSRRVVQYSAVFMILFAILGKVGALFAGIPKPVIGGMLCVMFSVIVAIGLASLQNVNLSNSRNIFILGCSMFFGLAIPKWLAENKGSIRTGSDVANQIITILLETSMFVGGTIGFILDNSISGTRKDRGLVEYDATIDSGIQEGDVKGKEENRDNDRSTSCYDLPIGMDFIKRYSWLRYVPVSPTFSGFLRKKKERLPPLNYQQ